MVTLTIPTNGIFLANFAVMPLFTTPKARIATFTCILAVAKLLTFEA